MGGRRPGSGGTRRCRGAESPRARLRVFAHLGLEAAGCACADHEVSLWPRLQGGGGGSERGGGGSSNAGRHLAHTSLAVTVDMHLSPQSCRPCTPRPLSRSTPASAAVDVILWADVLAPPDAPTPACPRGCGRPRAAQAAAGLHAAPCTRRRGGPRAVRAGASKGTGPDLQRQKGGQAGGYSPHEIHPMLLIPARPWGQKGGACVRARARVRPGEWCGRISSVCGHQGARGRRSC
jgi:hypothetical protein